MSRRFAPIATRRFFTWRWRASWPAASARTTSWPSDCTPSKKRSANFSVIPITCLSHSERSWALAPTRRSACLSLWFGKFWNDRRLARHCHYIGLPLSIAACVWSGFEPLAAVICLSGYAILYLLAVWTFAAPAVTYLAAAAIAGACYFGTTLVPGITAADQALAGALLGFAFWVSSRRAAPPARGSGLSHPLGSGCTGGFGRGDVRGDLAPHVCGHWLVDRGRGFHRHRGARLLAQPRTATGDLGSPLALKLYRIHHLRPWSGDGHPEPGAAPSGTALHRRRPDLAGGRLEGCDYGWPVASPSPAPDQTGDAVDSRWVWHILGGDPSVRDRPDFRGRFAGVIQIDETWLAGLVFLLGSVPMLWVDAASQARNIGLPRTGPDRRGHARPGLMRGRLEQPGDPGRLASGDRQLCWDWALDGGRAIAASQTLRVLYRALFPQWPSLSWSAPTSSPFTLGAWAAKRIALAATALGLNVLVTMLLARTWRTAEVDLSRRSSLRHGDLSGPLQRGQERPDDGLCLGPGGGARGHLALGDRDCLSARAATRGRTRAPGRFITGPFCLTGRRRFFWPIVHSWCSLLVAVSCLLTVKSLPRAEWLYGTVAALLAACYFRWLSDLPRIELVAWATLGGFRVWGTGRLDPATQSRHCAGGSRLIRSRTSTRSFTRRSRWQSSHWRCGFALSVDDRLPGRHGWFPLALAVLSLVMLRAYPHRACVHVSLAFLSWSRGGRDCSLVDLGVLSSAWRAYRWPWLSC